MTRLNQDYARQMEAAERRAHQLRREALEQFWTGVAGWLRSLWRGPRRA